jgi:hypothetical protein
MCSHRASPNATFLDAGRWSLLGPGSRVGPGNNAANVESWEALGHWYTGLTAGRRSPTLELSQKARDLTAGKADFDGKARTLASFLQTDVRSVAIEIGIGGYQPHPAGAIFHARYGDCGQRTLLSSLLQEVGIRSEYVLINNRGIVTPTNHSAIFNHAILAISRRLQSKRLLSQHYSQQGRKALPIFDPTDEYTPGDCDLSPDTYALLVTDAGGVGSHRSAATGQ